MKKIVPLVIGNWKLNPGTEQAAVELARGVTKTITDYSQVEVIVAPPFLFIPAVCKSIAKTNLRLGAQDAHFEERGACTGEVSSTLLAAYGVSHIIIGHSERRALGETNDQVAQKVVAVLKRRLTPVVCIGERERDEQGLYFNHLETQLRSMVTGLSASQVMKVVIAYEPIWAIGTGVTATPEDVKEMQLFIMSTLTKLYDRDVAGKVRLLYGGSVKESIAKALYFGSGMTGFLVGGASLDPREFASIVAATTG